MEITITLNGKTITRSILPDTLLIDFVRSEHCLSVKRGCDTSNCGLCTVLLNDKPVLSCSILAMRANGAKVVTLEGMQEEAKPLATFIASQGAEQCGFCSPGNINWNDSLKWVCISLTHWLTNPLGAQTRIRFASPRNFNSRMTSPASIVLPRPTSSANR